jgi:undecaprenyl-diphosphatase
MGLTGPAANAYAICIQAGAIVAVLGLYWQRVRLMLVGWSGKAGVGKGDETGFRMGLCVLVAFLPAAVIGFLGDAWIEEHLFGLWPIVAAWFFGGVAILAVGWWRRRQAGDEHVGKDLSEMTVTMALGVGLIQCAAMWPGTSRSLVTIVGGVLVGLRLVAAVEFSFLLGVVTLCAATFYKAFISTIEIMLDGQPAEIMMIQWMAREYGWANMLLGSLAAWVSAVLAVKWMVTYLKRHSMEIFGYYRIALAVIVAGLILAGWLHP